ncbi:MAG: hypothetical protein KIT09_27655 [Bryobacteraceae bacterium]|nr:hypothetical protein [Bryobacteraceae bacterium]
MGGQRQGKGRTDSKRVKAHTRPSKREGEINGEDIEPQDWLRKKSNVIDEILASIEAQLTEKDFKATIGDFIRLFQLRKEMEDERPREITVSWRESCGTEDAPAT